MPPPGTEFFDAETGRQNPPFRLLETGAETPRDSKSARSGGISAAKLDGVPPYHWVVEALGAQTGEPPPSHRTEQRLSKKAARGMGPSFVRRDGARWGNPGTAGHPAANRLFPSASAES